MWSEDYTGTATLTVSINDCGESGVVRLKIVQVEDCVGIDENMKEIINVYPNPAKDYLVFETPLVPSEHPTWRKSLRCNSNIGCFRQEVTSQPIISEKTVDSGTGKQSLLFYRAEIDGITDIQGKFIIQK
ncbi:MAG: hypothetical protein R2764_16370 [Bacteroidales bacterium]